MPETTKPNEWRHGDPLPLPADVDLWAEIDAADDEPTGVFLHRAGGDWVWSESPTAFGDDGWGDEAKAVSALKGDFYLRAADPRRVLSAEDIRYIRDMEHHAGDAWRALRDAEHALGRSAREAAWLDCAVEWEGRTSADMVAHLEDAARSLRAAMALHRLAANASEIELPR